MSTPVRREASLDLPDSVILVGPDTKWASPITWSDVGAQYPSLNDHQVGVLICRDFEVLALRGRLSYPNWRHLGGECGPVDWTYPSLDEIRAELGGHDLVCFCPLELPCHADVLLKLANERACRGCGCTDTRACPPTCWWVEPDLCSACVS